MFSSWAIEEDEFLKTGILSGIKAKDLIELLPNRTYHAIRGRIKKLKLRIRDDYWRTEEELILKENYSKGMSLDEFEKLLPNRTRKAIASRARVLNLKREDRCWTQEELDILKKYYPTSNEEEMLKVLPNRTYASMWTQASIMKLKKEAFWTKEEEELLKKKYKSKMSFEEIYELFPNRSYTSILHKASRLGVTKGKYTPLHKKEGSRRWTREEAAFLKTFHDSMTDDDLLRLLPDRTLSAIKGFLRTNKTSTQKCIRTKYRRKPEWCDTELKTLIENYNRLTYDELAKLLPDRTVKAIRARIRILGLKRDKEVWSNYAVRGSFKMWRDEELNILKDNADKSAEDIFKLLPYRSVHSVEIKAKQLGLTLKKSSGIG